MERLTGMLIWIALHIWDGIRTTVRLVVLTLGLATLVAYDWSKPRMDEARDWLDSFINQLRNPEEVVTDVSTTATTATSCEATEEASS